MVGHWADLGIDIQQYPVTRCSYARRGGAEDRLYPLLALAERLLAPDPSG